MNKKVVLVLGIFIFIIIGFQFFEKVSGNVVKIENGVQIVTIDMKNLDYSPKVIEVKKDVPVRFFLSNNVLGCYRNLVFPEMKINKYLPTVINYVEITFPEGEYTFACSMFMGTGKIIAK